jgi:N-acetylneuraminate synthase/sialic acid synthase
MAGGKMKRELRIGDFTINDDSECYVIAEIGHNHKGDIDICKQMFDEAKKCGCQAVKLQKRNNKSLFTDKMYKQQYNSENAYGATYGEHREALEFEWDEYVELQQYAKELGLHFYATAFDFESADFLAKLDVPAFKMASGDLKSIPLLQYVAKLGKPMILSTGGGSMEDVIRAYEAVKPINPNFAILQCTASYPASPELLNLRVVETFREEFPDIQIGLSSHDNGIAMPIAAYTLGARIVEKHFTLNRTWKGTDHAFSLEPVGLRKMVRDLNRTRAALGNGIKTVFEEEKAPIKKMGKKLVASSNLTAGQVISEDDICLKSPGDGLPPYMFEKVIGKRMKSDVSIDDDFTFDNVEI